MDSWLEGELMGEEEKKIIKKDLAFKRLSIVGCLMLLVVYFILGILEAMWNNNHVALIFRIVMIVIVVGSAAAIVFMYMRRIKFIKDGRFVWKQGFVTGYEPNEKMKFLHGRLQVDDTRSDYYGFKFGYKVGDQVFVLDFTEGFKWKDTIAVKIKY